MFVPSHYVAAEARSIINDYPLAMLFTSSDEELFSTASPVFFETLAKEEMTLVGHIARRNPQAAAMLSGQQALLVFMGPDAYVSGRWYAEKPQVPTWHYVSTQVRGILDPIDDKAGNIAVLRLTAERLEGDGWRMEDAPEGRVEALVPHIRSFRIRAASIEGIERLGQTHPDGDQLRVIAGLTRRAKPDDLAIARMMASRAGR
ncbi:MAG: FMN-binding negative transcriptional regulator [Neoaquamicrobium sediminum]|uniref:FMN-binding negative transcriptional regulator n=1 Tax=Neoaquamicrobium sediminum TaxID=1849104 RepID=UPI004036024D